MSKTQAKAASPSWKAWPYAKRLLIVASITVFVGGSVLRASQTVGTNETPVGFYYGVFHGAVMPCMMPALLLGRDVVIYAPNNNGHGYRLGYTVGVNGCGLLFFGILFWRLNRLRRRMNGHQ